MKTLCTFLFMVSIVVSMSQSWAMERLKVKDAETQTDLIGSQMEAYFRNMKRSEERNQTIRMVAKEKTIQNQNLHATLRVYAGVSPFIIVTLGGVACILYAIKKSWEYKG